MKDIIPYQISHPRLPSGSSGAPAGGPGRSATDETAAIQTRQEKDGKDPDEDLLRPQSHSALTPSRLWGPEGGRVQGRGRWGGNRSCPTQVAHEQASSWRKSPDKTSGVLSQ